MAYVTKDGEKYNFDRWVENQDWKNPNAGALCVGITNSESGVAFDDAKAGSLTPANNFSMLSDIGNISDANELKDLAFYSDSTANKCAVIFSPYGGVMEQIKPLYFTFTEGKIDGSKYAFDNVDNFLVLKLNAITGQVTYFDPYEE